ncbi:hypothetical protein SAMD00019534_023910, partial [Acytostelium subglobosum LB1]|uniref:hypothetical protein n=1 Tax=Acytostelium subglobosum LB1 TaxID=1410327 RepID=UPI00064500C9
MEEGTSSSVDRQLSPMGAAQHTHTGVQLSFRDIVYKVPNKRYMDQHSMAHRLGFKKVSKDEKETEKEITILHGVSGVIERGELVALMGPSGSGKSTLLDILAKRKNTGHINGQLLVNGREIGDAYKNYCSYVTQEDILTPTSTVEETLKFHADLRLSDRTEAEKMTVIHRVMEEVGLAHKGNAKIGGVLPGGINVRGLSGGEKRRVSIGCGLVTDPALIFLDEPTSGLDSVNALVVMKTLLSLTRKGVTVIVSIHQPRPEIWQLFNKVMVLVKGRMIYSGADLLGYFDTLGYPTPPYVNPADFCLDAAVEIGDSSRYQEICDKWTDKWESELIGSTNPSVGEVKTGIVPGLCYQYRVLIKRAFRDFIRNPGNFATRTITPIIMALLFGACFAGLGNSQEDIQKIIGVIYFMINGLNLTPFVSISL